MIKQSALRFVLILVLLGIPLMALGIWWGIFISSLVAAFMLSDLTWRQALLWGAIAGGGSWLIWSICVYFGGGQIITHRIAELFQVPTILLFIFTLLIGSLLGATGGLAGSFDISAFKMADKDADETN